jgi:uncharacterized protein YfiM (DUF2279 family)
MHCIIRKKRRKISSTIIFMVLAFSVSPATFGKSIPKDSFTGKDKFQHFAISAAMTAATGFVLHNHFKTNRDNAIAIGFTASFTLGGIKELIDKKTPGEQSSWKDLAADFVGCAAGAAILTGATK